MSVPARLSCVQSDMPGCGALQKNVADFGCFVDIGCGKDGLVHISQLSVSPAPSLPCFCVVSHDAAVACSCDRVLPPLVAQHARPWGAYRWAGDGA